MPMNDTQQGKYFIWKRTWSFEQTEVTKAKRTIIWFQYTATLNPKPFTRPTEILYMELNSSDHSEMARL